MKEESDRVVLANVPRPWGCCSSLAALTAALRHRGEDVTLPWLMGVSSRAFRLQFSWCPSAPHAHIGFNVFAPALKAMGYEATQHAGTFSFAHEETDKGGLSTEEEREAARRAVKAAIDAGEVVIFGSEEDALIAGYEPISEENPTGWLCRPGPLGGPPLEDEPYVLPVREIPWGYCTLRKVADPMPRREAVLWAIKTAVSNAERGTVKDSDLKTGFAAWEKWIKDLPDFDRILEETRRDFEVRKRDDDPAFSLQLGNGWCYENLYFARRDAAWFLREVAAEFPEAARPHLRKAADEYEKVIKALVPEDDCFTKIAPYPFMEEGRDWNDAMRIRQAGLLHDALLHERAAIDALKAALDVINEASETSNAI